MNAHLRDADGIAGTQYDVRAWQFVETWRGDGAERRNLQWTMAGYDWSSPDCASSFRSTSRERPPSAGPTTPCCSSRSINWAALL